MYVKNLLHIHKGKKGERLEIARTCTLDPALKGQNVYYVDNVAVGMYMHTKVCYKVQSSLIAGLKTVCCSLTR